jgi:hypothetical protein
MPQVSLPTSERKQDARVSADGEQKPSQLQPAHVPTLTPQSAPILTSRKLVSEFIPKPRQMVTEFSNNLEP